ncbi:dipeptidase PepV [Priestia taiwanensis]|nr:dipeptidase PepV [Priestia taiwanensis]
MTEIKWMDEVLKRKELFLNDTCEFLQIKSVLDEDSKVEGAPFGKGIEEALYYMLHKGEKDEFVTKNVDGYAGHIEMGQGEELVGILCHVDVVPEGDGWTTDPYSADIRDGKIFARGAIDDKGPTMAAYYAMKIVKELGLPLNKRVRMILGTDEESNWGCVEHYFANEEMPTMGFAPDADFPIIYAEKGIMGFDFVQEVSGLQTEGRPYELVSFQSGRRQNMVPDFAKAIVQTDEKEALLRTYNDYLIEKQLVGKCYIENNDVHLELEGISAHGMEPNNGKNAGLYLGAFLHTLSLDEQAKHFTSFIATYLLEDTRGVNLEVAYNDDITGDLTVNAGQFSYDKANGGKVGISLRYPVTADGEKVIATLREKSASMNFVVMNDNNSNPHHVDKNHPLIQTLQRVYEEQTGEEATLLSIGGGTYARSLEAGVAFGPLFPGKPEVAHQKDEYVEIDDLLKATAIYAQAIYELAK